ncbi:unnamed protein product [Cylicocyclus nassatus]|uniref:L-Fucosyltransferase n=1 Tax=Cylicocyclus nassatus TaxID=53992 RepID=A0AA36HD39_CYLNA|nr:unnamed protein product [Cylicocyclus nassatus]
MITGYGIARTMNRIHYLPYEGRVRIHVEKYLIYLERIFPRLKQTYVLAKRGTEQRKVRFASSCCTYYDPLRKHICTSLNTTVKAANTIARKMNISHFIVFGDDHKFMTSLSKAIVNDGGWKKDAVAVSKYKEYLDLFLASQLCSSFLITAVTSTFGWWLAFFVPNQNAIYYLNDTRRHADKRPNKELFL